MDNCQITAEYQQEWASYITYQSVYHASVRYVHLKLRFKTQHTTRYMLVPRQLKMYENSYWFRSRRSSWDITVGY